jgi:hypothetical protein
MRVARDMAFPAINAGADEALILNPRDFGPSAASA